MATVERARAARVLGVDTTAPPEQVRDAFRRRAHEAHPDKVGGDAAAMAELNAAYEALSVRAGDGWEFAGSPTASRPMAPPFDDVAPFDVNLDPQSGAGWSLLRALRSSSASWAWS